MVSSLQAIREQALYYFQAAHSKSCGYGKTMNSLYEEVNGKRIHYEKIGTGSQILLLVPGAVGCSRSDFKSQLDEGGLDRNLFTMIAIDLPGFGKSRPPERVYTKTSYYDDCLIAAGLMDKLGYKLYSLLGWSDGSKISLLIAIKFQARIDKLVVWGVVPWGSDYDIKAVSMTRDISIFDETSKKLYADAYGWDVFEQLWRKHVDFCTSFSTENGPVWDIRDELKHIKCPTLILHGDKDSLIDKTHPYTAEKLIPDSRLIRYANGSHNIHQTHTKEFNKAVTEFLLE